MREPEFVKAAIECANCSAQLSEQWSDFKVKLDRVSLAFDETMQLPFEIEQADEKGL